MSPAGWCPAGPKPCTTRRPPRPAAHCFYLSTALVQRARPCSAWPPAPAMRQARCARPGAPCTCICAPAEAASGRAHPYRPSRPHAARPAAEPPRAPTPARSCWLLHPPSTTTAAHGAASGTIHAQATWSFIAAAAMVRSPDDLTHQHGHRQEICIQERPVGEGIGLKSWNPCMEQHQHAQRREMRMRAWEAPAPVWPKLIVFQG